MVVVWCRPAKYSFSLYKINSATLGCFQRRLLVLVERQVSVGGNANDDIAHGDGLVAEDIGLEVGQILVVNGVEEKLLGPGLYGHMLIVRRPVDVVLAELAIPRVLVRQ